MEIKYVFFAIAIIYWVIKTLSGSSDAKKAVPNSKKKKGNTSKTPTLDEILREFNKELNRKTSSTKPKAKTATSNKTVKKNLDWQQVERSHLKPKEQLIKHEDYHAEHGKIKDFATVDEIANSEGQVYQFDTSKIDWKQAIIAKEILDRKFV